MMALPILPDPLILLARPSMITLLAGPSGSGKTQMLINLSRVSNRLMRYVTATQLLSNEQDLSQLISQDAVVENLLIPGPYGDGAKRFGTIARALDNLSPNDIVLLDDLETAMHPDLAKATTNFVLGRTTQQNVKVFIATHNLCVVDAVLNFFPPQGGNINLVKLSRQLPYEIIGEQQLRSMRTPCEDIRLDTPQTLSCGC